MILVFDTISKLSITKSSRKGAFGYLFKIHTPKINNKINQGFTEILKVIRFNINFPLLLNLTPAQGATLRWPHYL